ncbi:MAG: ATP-grasp domain-containing protein [Pirellulales bacterium]|nr:ATP-grasp domain-containing protein [Pirellulales bacterium]
MRLFLFEFITGGGLLSEARQPSGSILAEGRAMLTALSEDLSAIDGVDVALTIDDRLDVKLSPECSVRRVRDEVDEAEAFSRLARECEATILIAPEFDGTLLYRAERVVANGGRLLSCLPKTISITADKQATADLLAKSGVLVPMGGRWPDDVHACHELTFPAVLKPNDGAGSQGVRLVESFDDLPLMDDESNWRVEQYCPGIAASCAVLCGLEQLLVLPACRQHLEPDGSFGYRGGSTIADDALAGRARSLAQSAVAALPDPLGYVGVDMILGEDVDGRDDYVIEVNPRLTTSYVGVRHVANGNLAEVMLDVALGRAASVSWRDAGVHFVADGTIVEKCAEAIH